MAIIDKSQRPLSNEENRELSFLANFIFRHEITIQYCGQDTLENHYRSIAEHFLNKNGYDSTENNRSETIRNIKRICGYQLLESCVFRFTRPPIPMTRSG